MRKGKSEEVTPMQFSIVKEGCPPPRPPLLILELCRTNGLSNYWNRAYRCSFIGHSEVCRTIQLCTLRTEEKARISVVFHFRLSRGSYSRATRSALITAHCTLTKFRGKITYQGLVYVPRKHKRTKTPTVMITSRGRKINIEHMLSHQHNKTR